MRVGNRGALNFLCFPQCYYVPSLVSTFRAHARARARACISATCIRQGNPAWLEFLACLAKTAILVARRVAWCNNSSSTRCVTFEDASRVEKSPSRYHSWARDISLERDREKLSAQQINIFRDGKVNKLWCIKRYCAFYNSRLLKWNEWLKLMKNMYKSLYYRKII